MCDLARPVLLLPVLFVGLSAIVLHDDGHYGGSEYGQGSAGFERSSEGIVAPYSNQARQLAVNLLALRVGSGTGTGLFYGVPGTGLEFNGGGGRGAGRKDVHRGYEVKSYRQIYKSEPYTTSGYRSHGAKGYTAGLSPYRLSSYGGNTIVDARPKYRRQHKTHGFWSKYGHSNIHGGSFGRPIFTKAHLFY